MKTSKLSKVIIVVLLIVFEVLVNRQPITTDWIAIIFIELALQSIILNKDNEEV